MLSRTCALARSNSLDPRNKLLDEQKAIAAWKAQGEIGVGATSDDQPVLHHQQAVGIVPDRCVAHQRRILRKTQ